LSLSISISTYTEKNDKEEREGEKKETYKVWRRECRRRYLKDTRSPLPYRHERISSVSPFMYVTT